MAISATVFNSIPAALRVPGWYIEFDNRLAGNAVFQGKLLVLGQMLASGDADPGVPLRITNPEQADDAFGRGSMLAEQFRAIKEVDIYTETWAIPLEDAELAVKATGAIEVTAGPSQTRPLALYVAGYRVWCEMEAGATAEEAAQAIVDAVNGDDRVPVTAELDGTTASKVTLTCRWGGETGNDIDLRDSVKGEVRPRGLQLTYTAFADGAVNPELDVAIAAMGSEWWNWSRMTRCAKPSAIKPKRSPVSSPSPDLTKQTIRRATRPAICTTARSRPSSIRMHRLLRSLSALALSSEALKNLPGR